MPSHRIVPAAALAGFLLLAVAGAAHAGEAPPVAPLVDPPKDLVAETPAGFPRFEFQGHPEVAQRLGRFLWHNFSASPIRGIKTMFNREYYGIADLWLNAANVKVQDNQPVQQVIRDHLLSIEVDGEGYVNTHQHASHAHDKGWPFPLWNQTMSLPGIGVDGLTAGWHWQTDVTGKLWIGDHMRMFPAMKEKFWGDNARRGWTLNDLKDDGVTSTAGWRLIATGPKAALTSPAGVTIDAGCAPYLQLRWTRHGVSRIRSTPYVEFQREGDTAFSPERRVYVNDVISPSQSYSGGEHVFFKMYDHPLWTDKIHRLRLTLAPGCPGAVFVIDSFFCVYDTRMAYNALYVLASSDYFAWTGDLDFLRVQLPRMRMALRYMQTEMGGLAHNFIRIPFFGHTGRPGFELDAEDLMKKAPMGRPELLTGSLPPAQAIKKAKWHVGQAIGGNYYDILPFGNEDFYATAEYYACLLRMAEMEEAIARNPGWGMGRGTLAFAPADLRAHAAKVKAAANEKFWDENRGRFIGCVDIDGKAHDYGFTFLNELAIWYGIANEEHARAIMDWMDGRRIVAGDTSTGADIYRWRLAPRATTRRNLDWYHYMWATPEIIKWGDQVQDGGAVLGFSFFDLIARHRVLGADNAWGRLKAIMDWDDECWQAGGYRAYYKDGKPGTTMQGGGTAGGVGIDQEFLETSMVPAIVVRGFLGLNPDPESLCADPAPPPAAPRVGVSDMLYRGVRLDVAAERQGEDLRLTIELKDEPIDPLRVRLAEGWRGEGIERREGIYLLPARGRYTFVR
ncbi:MAG: hypothetical protein ACOY3P_08240 [Planctomycetota bacterium]